jgi:hypothetical protein
MLQALLEETAAFGAVALFLAMVGLWAGVFTGAI